MIDKMLIVPTLLCAVVNWTLGKKFQTKKHLMLIDPEKICGREKKYRIIWSGYSFFLWWKSSTHSNFNISITKSFGFFVFSLLAAEIFYLWFVFLLETSREKGKEYTALFSSLPLSSDMGKCACVTWDNLKHHLDLATFLKFLFFPSSGSFRNDNYFISNGNWLDDRRF